jgi:hypothetical protein
MKTRVVISIFTLLAVPVIYFTSCQKAKELTAVDVSLKLQRTHFTYTVSTLKNGEVILYSGLVNLNLDSVLNAYGFSSGTIQNTYFTYLAVTIEQPPSATLGWLSSMRATVSDNQNFQPENQIGSVTNTDPNATTVVVTMNNLNIRPFLSKPSFYVRLYGVINGQLPATTVGMFFDGSIQFRVAPL